MAVVKFLIILNNFVFLFVYPKNSLYLCRRNRVRMLSALAQKIENIIPNTIKDKNNIMEHSLIR